MTVSAPQATLRAAVIGAGISGLAAAKRLHELCAGAGRPLELTVFEAEDRAGGLLETQCIAGYRVELGADSFITNKPWAADLCRQLGLEDRLIATEARYRRSLVLKNGRPVPVPEGFQLMAPQNVGAFLRSPILSWRGKLRVALECVIPRGDANGDESVAHFVRRRFGREALERLVQPLVGGIYTSDPDQLSLRATLPRFLEMEQQHGSVIRALKRHSGSHAEDSIASGARYGLFASLQGGISELVAALVERVSTAATMRYGARVERLAPEPDRGGFALELGAGVRDRFEAIVVAVPAYCAANLLAGFAPTAAESLRAIEYASTAIVASGHKLADIRDPLDAFGLVVPAIERRRILAVSFASRKFPDRAPEGCVQLRTFVGGAMQPELLQLSDAELTALVRSELESIFGVAWKPDFTLVARWIKSMPQYHVGHLERVAAIEQALARFPRLALAGNALYGVGLPDAIYSGKQAAERVFSTASSS
ncbi:MAG: protoporphyrinogen oxidase [Planctomycetaceae bacterium]